MENTNEGWTCPTCKTVYAPTVKTCAKCTTKNESEIKDSRQLLTE